VAHRKGNRLKIINVSYSQADIKIAVDLPHKGKPTAFPLKRHGILSIIYPNNIWPKTSS